MNKATWIFSLLACSIVGFTGKAAVHADAVAGYDPGSGFATEFGSGIGLTNATVALGEPSRVTPGPFGGPVNPFNPPFSKEQLVSIGEGGFLTLEFSSSIQNDPAHPFGMDFILFGNTGFVVTNQLDEDFNFVGTPVTDGSLFGNTTGETRVSVSQDNQIFFSLDPLRAPVVDGLFPTDGAGDFSLPVDPNLTGADFAGKDLGGIRDLYAGSGGGAAFDIDWALDDNGDPIDLSSIRFVRIDVLSGKAEIDAIAAIPEPGTLAFIVSGSAILLLWALRKKGLLFPAS